MSHKRCKGLLQAHNSDDSDALNLESFVKQGLSKRLQENASPFPSSPHGSFFPQMILMSFI